MINQNDSSDRIYHEITLYKALPFESLDREKALELALRDEDLEGIVDKEKWVELGVDGKFLSQLSKESMKEQLKICKAGPRQMLSDFIRKNQPMVYIEDHGYQILKNEN